MQMFKTDDPQCVLLLEELSFSMTILLYVLYGDF